MGEIELKKEFQELKNLTLLGAKKVLTMRDVCTLSGLSMSHIYKKCSNKTIPHWKGAGGKITYFDKSEIENWLLHQRVKTSDEVETEAANYIVTGKKKGVVK